MFTYIDNKLNSITMYKTTLYVLVFIITGATFLSTLRILHYNPFAILYATAFFLFFCAIVNDIFSYVFEVPTNTESVYITALILTLLITPPSSVVDDKFYAIAFPVAVLAMASKYIFAIKKRHIWNPAAFAIVLTSLTLGLSATWWIGTAVMLPFVLVGGLILVRKIRRFDLVLPFLTVAILTIMIPSLYSGVNITNSFWRTLINSPLFFFAFIMLTEPLTAPPTSKLRMIYGGAIGFLFAPWVHIGTFYTTPEIALLLGNIGSYFVSSKDNLLLKLKTIETIALDTKEFIFESPTKLRYKAGQYMEWTLPHENPDSRGNRRYLTISSSPTEDTLRIGVKFCTPSSTYKQKLLSLKEGDTITASHLMGDFVLPLNTKQKIVFIAGGIGITPFRSMIKYLLDSGEKRDIALLYANKKIEDIAYKNIFDEAQLKFNLQTTYLLSETETIPNGWTGERGMLNKEIIERRIPDYTERIFYIAGPMGMVVALSKTLVEIGLKDSQIKKDFFPGF